MRSSKVVTHLVSFCCLCSFCIADDGPTCPLDFYYDLSHNATRYGGYSEEQKCVTFVPKSKIPRCGRPLHECLEEFCLTEFSGGHLMKWEDKEVVNVKQLTLQISGDSVKVLNGRIITDRVPFKSRRRGQSNAWTNFDCVSMNTYCATGCTALEYCYWLTNGWDWHMGGWYNYFITSDYLQDLQGDGRKQVLGVKLPACRNLVLLKDIKPLAYIRDLYQCYEENFDYFACQHKKYQPCRVKKVKMCHYSIKHNECRLWKYEYINYPGKYGRPCEKENVQTCKCPCAGKAQDWSPWSASCGTATRSRYKPKNPEGGVDCAKNPSSCCKEEESKRMESCSSYAYNTDINLRIENCRNGSKGVDDKGHLQCICDPGFEGVLCEKEIDNCASNPCQNGATCESVKGIFLCHCKNGWIGYLCKEKRTECKEGETCLNGGTCIDEADGSHFCKCPETHGGLKCEYAKSWCKSETCYARGYCVNVTSLGTWKCYCNKGFTGSRCEIAEEGFVDKGTVERAEEPGYGIRIWIIALLVLSGVVLLLGGRTTYTKVKKRRRRRQSQATVYDSSRRGGRSESSVSKKSYNRATKSRLSRVTEGWSKAYTKPYTPSSLRTGTSKRPNEKGR